MKVVITLGSDEKSTPPLQLTLKCEKHPLAKKWIEALMDIVDQRVFLEKHNNLMGFPQSSRGLKEISNEINDCIKIINAFKWKKDFEILERAQHDMDQERLNALHHHFEILTGLTWEPSPWFEEADQKTRVAIMFYNHLIHEFEYKKRSLEQVVKWGEGRATSSLNLPYSNPKHIDLNSDDFGYFNLSRNFGDVFLHYSQLGKTYEEAYYDDDEVVQDKSVNPHRYFTGEFNVYLGPDATKEYMENHQKKFFGWLESKGIDPKDPNLCLGEARVAKLMPRGEQKKWSVHQFQTEVAKRPNIVSLEVKNFFGSIKCFYDYTPKQCAEKMEEYFNTGSWD